jgi:septum formation protein
VPHSIVHAPINEVPLRREKPIPLVSRLSLEKALSVRKTHPHEPILAADTIVSTGQKIIGKAAKKEDALATLKHLSGRRHRIITSVCLSLPSAHFQKTVVSTVAFKRLSPHEIQSYLETLEWQNCAGSYAIQGKAAMFVRFISGSYSNIVGLPLFETSQLLRGHNLLP